MKEQEAEKKQICEKLLVSSAEALRPPCSTNPLQQGTPKEMGGGRGLSWNGGGKLERGRGPAS